MKIKKHCESSVLKQVVDGIENIKQSVAIVKFTESIFHIPPKKKNIEWKKERLKKIYQIKREENLSWRKAWIVV